MKTKTTQQKPQTPKSILHQLINGSISNLDNLCQRRTDMWNLIILAREKDFPSTSNLPYTNQFTSTLKKRQNVLIGLYMYLPSKDMTIWETDEVGHFTKKADLLHEYMKHDMNTWPDWLMTCSAKMSIHYRYDTLCYWPLF